MKSTQPTLIAVGGTECADARRQRRGPGTHASRAACAGWRALAPIDPGPSIMDGDPVGAGKTAAPRDRRSADARALRDPVRPVGRLVAFLFLALLTLALGPVGHAEDCFTGCSVGPPPGDFNPHDPIAIQICQCALGFKLEFSNIVRPTTGIGPTPGEACPQACAVLNLLWVPLDRSCSGVTADGTRALSASERIVQCGWGFRNVPNWDIISIPELDNLVAREKRAVDQVLDLHLLPESDRGKIMGYARDSVRAVLFADLLGIIDQPDPRTEVEQRLVDVYADLVRRKRLIAAEFALSEYNRWDQVVCLNNGFGYVPPLGFSYPNQSTACSGIGSFFSGPVPPSSEEFIAYGTAHAFNRMSTDAQTVAVAARTARASGFAGAVVGAGAAGVATSLIVFNTALGATLVQALFPYAFFQTFIPNAVTFVGTTVAGGLTLSSVAAIGSAVAIVILAIVVGVLQGIAVFDAAQIPGELQARVAAAQIAPDLRASIQTPAGLQELYAVFIESTMPDYPATEPPPAPVASDLKFRVKNEQGQNLGVFPVIKLQSPSAPGNWEMRLSGGWFVPKYNNNGTPLEDLTLSVAYFDWNGTQRLAWRRGDQFIITNPDATSPSDAGEIVDQIRYKDWDGNKRIASITAGDTTPPVITPAIDGTLGTNDWYRSDVLVTWTVEDPESDIQSSSGCGPRSITQDGITAFSCTATSEGGTSSRSLTIKRDATLPVIQDDRDLVPNSAGWYKSDVTISFACDDALSGVAECSGPQTVSSEGANQSVTGSATDKAGNTATRTVSVSIDKTAPRIRDSRMLAANAAGWYRSDVTVVFVCDDALSGVTTCTAPQTLSSEGENQSVSGSATDRAGNTASSTVGGISIDKTPPVVTINVPANGAEYILGEAIIADWTVSDALSGIKTQQGTANNGAAIDTASAGEKSFQVSATDQADNSAASTHTYTVLSTVQATEGLINSVTEAGLDPGQANALNQVLRNAVNSANRGNTNAAAGQLNAFINQVEAQRGKKIDPAIADQLIGQARKILVALTIR